MDTTEPESNHANLSVLILRENTRTIISNLLNPQKYIKTDRGIPRDWQGLAELCGISGEIVRSISHNQDPTGKVLKIWSDDNKSGATIDKLLCFLAEIDRDDVVDDIEVLIAEDIKFHKEHLSIEKNVQAFDLEADKFILTRDDVMRINKGLEPQRYDAFVLFADDDIAFATELIENMEKNYNLKFCVKERDLVVGGSEHDAVIKLITERCGRLIVIISAAFLQSNANKFFYSLAQSIAIEQRQRKIIPCIYKDCGVLPPELSCYFKLDFRRAGTLWNFWDKLHDSIKMPEYKAKTKYSLPENSLFKGFDSNHLKVSNTVSRSVSNPNQLLSPNDLKSALHKDSSQRSICHSVKFSSTNVSMNDLPRVDVPEDNMEASTSANSLGKCEEKSVRKSFSFYKRLKNIGLIFPKYKSKGDNQSAEPENAKKETKLNGNLPIDKSTDRNQNTENKIAQPEIQDAPIDIKEGKKLRKNLFTLKKKKKVAVLADT